MTRSVKVVVLGLVVVMAPWLSGAQARVVAPGAKVQKLAGGFEFTEGPTCDREGNLSQACPITRCGTPALR